MIVRFEIATAPGETLNLGDIGPQMDALFEAATETQVIGPVTTEHQSSQGQRDEAGGNLNVTASPSAISSTAGASAKTETSLASSDKVQKSGNVVHRVRFGAIGQTLAHIARSVAPRRLWLLLDEWSAVPPELQPYLADMIRRCLLPVQGLTVKIAAIEQRTNLLMPGGHGDYTGIELGADVAADLNLDDFMVFDHNATRAVDFFRRLIHNHYATVQL